jgi:succinate dehydrogenase/fumarate reductase cytochrome b subunit
MTPRHLHRLLAVFLGLFLALHLGNHLAGFWGQETHGTAQAAVRIFYRNPVVEALLLAAICFQICLGLMLLTRRRRLTLQTLSGGYLALFLLIHLAAVLSARWQGTETDLAFAAAGMHAPLPWPMVFAAYYGLAVMAVFAHLSVPLSRRNGLAGRVCLVTGAALAGGLVALLSGLVTPLKIPPALIAAFP